ncbi:MAG: MBL fold metallo-hydrolase [Gemmatimonadota bacterium]|jgi:glyoxylase-like metal-dependent hydrolase (beta-lactamase superfamily II)|nr:MBL fold metallo-hydrolase [Gemmatimonadota bacterium]
MAFPDPLLQTFQIGRWRAHAIQAGGQQLDGGAMFGVVPKPLWEKRLAADARNRIPMGMRCLLVEHDLGLVLVDTGAGNKEPEKFYDIYGIENARRDGATALEDGIRAAGHAPEDVAFVINTHLHFDHAGGNTVRDGDRVRPTFPEATYVVQLGEYLYATHTNERTAASYFAPNFVPLFEAERLELVTGKQVVLPGITVLPTPGHVPHHQSVLVQSGGETLCFLGDVCPTAHHLPLPWIMGYDVEPLVTLESKRWLLRQAAEEGWTVMFEHDAHVAMGKVAHDGKAYGLR